jgi:hypothetical protein
MARVLAGALIGVICTIIFYFIPGVNVIAPLLGGFLAGYYADGGFGGGLKTGILMTVFMVIPGILLGGILGSLLIGVPVIGGFVAASTFVINTGYCSSYRCDRYHRFSAWGYFGRKEGFWQVSLIFKD